MLKRTHTCGELRKDHIGESVNLNGWVNTVRLHGQVIFIDLRDRYGKTQIIFNSENYNGEFKSAKKLSLEDVLSITGTVQERGKGADNPDLTTGEIIRSQFPFFIPTAIDSEILTSLSDEYSKIIDSEFKSSSAL